MRYYSRSCMHFGNFFTESGDDDGICLSVWSWSNSCSRSTSHCKNSILLRFWCLSHLVATLSRKPSIFTRWYHSYAQSASLKCVYFHLSSMPALSFWWSATLVSVRTLGKDWPRWLLKMASASLFVAWMPSVSSGETSRRSTPPCPGLAIRPIRRPRWYGRLPFQHPDAPNGQSGGSPLAATPEDHQVARNAHLLA